MKALLTALLVLLAAPAVAAPADAVRADSLWATLRALTGDVPVALDDSTVTIDTRFTPTVGYDRAARFLAARCAAWGYTVSREYFVPATLTALDIRPTSAWVAGLPVSSAPPTLARSRDGGDTWLSAPTPPPLSRIFAVLGGGGDTVVVAGATVDDDSSAVAWSPDGGHTWDAQSDRPGVFYAMTRAGSRTWVCGENGAILISDDGGRTWLRETVPASGTIYGIAAANDSTVWAVGAAGTVLRRSGTPGAWHTVALGFVDALRAVTFADSRHGWIVGTNGITTSTRDGGATWTLSGVGNAVLTTVVARDSQTVFAAGFSGAFLRSTSGGQQWTSVASGTTGDLYSLALGGAQGDSLWQAGRQRLAVSADAGSMWSTRNSALQSGWFSLVAARPGTAPASGSVLLCGHLDSHSETPWTRAPGADDNASGSALLLEVARVLAVPATPRALHVVWFGGEEDGLLGSTARAAEQRAAHDSLALVVDCDEVGRGTSMTVYGNALSAPDLDSVVAIATRAAPNLPLLAAVDPTYRGSDQAPYWDQGYHAVSFVESAWRDNHDIESTRDSLGAVDTSLVVRLARVVAEVAAAYLSPASTAAPELPPDATSPSAAGRVTALTIRRMAMRATVSVPYATQATLTLFDPRGRRVGTVSGVPLRAGTHTLDVPIDVHAARGVYLWRLDAADDAPQRCTTTSGRAVAIR